MCPKDDTAQEDLCETPEDQFKVIRHRLERSFEDSIIAVGEVNNPEGLIICLSNHHVHDIARAINAYIDELESAYLNGELRCPNSKTTEADRQPL